MSEVVDRVADAIEVALVKGQDRPYRETRRAIARAAIAAMREPSDAITRALTDEVTRQLGEPLNCEAWLEDAAAVWQAGASAALKE